MKTNRNSFYFVRHGESTANRRGLIICDPQDGITGWGLSAAGKKQVHERTYDFLGHSHIDLVCSSDFLRARETAGIICTMSNAPLRLTPLLRERSFGSLHGQPDHCYEQVWHNDALQHPSEGVESIQSVLTRSFTVLRWLDHSNKNATIVLVTHGDVIQITLAALCRHDACEHRQLNPVANAEYREIGAYCKMDMVCRKYKLKV